MTIAEAREICKELAAKAPRDALVVGILVASSTISFGLGYLSGTERAANAAPDARPQNEEADTAPAGASAAYVGTVVASKNGTKYYAPDCAGASRILESNRITFRSPAQAVAAGYAPSATCKEL